MKPKSQPRALHLPESEKARFTLYGVTKYEAAAEDNQISLTLEAHADIEVDLLHAGLTIWGFLPSDIAALRLVLKRPDLRDELDFLLRKARQQELEEQKSRAEA